MNFSGGMVSLKRHNFSDTSRVQDGGKLFVIGGYLCMECASEAVVIGIWSSAADS